MIDIEWFDKKDIYSIHEKSLELIEEVGFKLDDADLLKKLKGFDTKIDLSNRSIRISKKVSEDFLTKIPIIIKSVYCALNTYFYLLLCLYVHENPSHFYFKIL